MHLPILLLFCAGNPVRSIVLQQFRKGYMKFAAEQGYKQRSAMPWTEQEVQAVLQHIETEVTGLEGMPAALLARDGFLFAILWQTKSRGCNAGTWRMDNLRLPAGSTSAVSCAMKCCSLALRTFLKAWC